MNPLLAIPRPRTYVVPEPAREQPFSGVTTAALAQIVAGAIDPVEAAAFELQARCRDMAGNYVGPKESGKRYQQWKEINK